MKEQCPREESLSRLHDGELGGEDLRELREHLATCLPCGRYQQSLIKLDQVARAPLLAVKRTAPERALRRGLWLVAACGLLGLSLLWTVSMKSKPNVPSRDYSVASADGETYLVETRGDVRLLSIEVNGMSANFQEKERRK